MMFRAKEIVKSVLKRLYHNDIYHIIDLQGRRCEKSTNLPPELTIEQIQPDHFATLVDNWPPSVSYLAPDRETLIHLLESRIQNNEIGIISQMGKKFVGMSWLSRHDLHLKILTQGTDQNEICWKNIYVAPEYRRLGIAVAHYNFVVGLLRQNRIEQLLAFVQKENEKSLRFMTETIGGGIIGQLVFQNRWGQRNCYFEDLYGDFHYRSYPPTGGYLS